MNQSIICVSSEGERLQNEVSPIYRNQTTIIRSLDLLKEVFQGSNLLTPNNTVLVKMLNKILALVKEVLEMKSIKNVKWNTEKKDDLRIVVESKTGYKTQLLVNVGLDGKLNIFYFSDEAGVIYCLIK